MQLSAAPVHQNINGLHAAIIGYRWQQQRYCIRKRGLSRGMGDAADRVAWELVQRDERWWINESGRKNAQVRKCAFAQ